MGRALSRALRAKTMLLRWLFLALLAWCQASCSPGSCGLEGGESDEERAELARGDARRGGFIQAKDVAFYARELAKLNPGSERAKASRRARQLLDEYVDEPDKEAAPGEENKRD